MQDIKRIVNELTPEITVIVEYKNAKEDPEGWIAWDGDGNECPFDFDQLKGIEVKDRRGDVVKRGHCMNPSEWNWNNGHTAGLDVVAYRFVKKAEADADGWIPHTPGKARPCDPEQPVDVMLDSGNKDSSGIEADEWNWSILAFPRIIAWRHHKPQPQDLPPHFAEREAKIEELKNALTESILREDDAKAELAAATHRGNEWRALSESQRAKKEKAIGLLYLCCGFLPSRSGVAKEVADFIVSNRTENA